MRGFGSSSIVAFSEKYIAVTKSFESYSELVASSVKMKVFKKKCFLMNSKSPETSYLEVCVVITIYVIQKSLLTFYEILILILIQVLAFWIKERRIQWNHNLHLLQSNIRTNFFNYWVYFNRAGTRLHGQSNLLNSMFLYHDWTWILIIGVKVGETLMFT